MGNWVRKLLLAPGVEERSVRALALAVRSRNQRPVTFTWCDLDGRRVRDPRFKLAQALGVRQVEIDGRVPPELLQSLAATTLGEGTWLHCERDDDETDVCVPGPGWLEQAFGAADLAWLLEPEEAPAPWNRRSYHALPGNPEAWDVTVPIALRLLTVTHAGAPRPCPACGEEFTSKREDRCQCPACGFVSRPFASDADARRIDLAPLDAFAWGKCPRCHASRQFTAVIEQCHRCGRLLEAKSRHSLELADNRSVVEALLRTQEPPAPGPLGFLLRRLRGGRG